MTANRTGHIRLTSHPGAGAPSRFPITWGAPTARQRGPVIGTVSAGADRNAVGAHGGAYAIYRALAVSSGVLNPIARPDLTNTAPVVEIGPYPQWSQPNRIVSLDPWGHRVSVDFRQDIAEGLDIRPTIAVTRGRLTIPEVHEAVVSRRLAVDGDIITSSGDLAVTKAAIDPVWFLPGIAARFGVVEDQLRHTLFEQTGGMYPELVTRPDRSVFLPPIGGITLYIFGDATALADRRRSLACRVHGIEECVKEALRGGVGLIVYNGKEGRALGEVTKFLVYNARKRQAGGDKAATYFERTECVAGVQDARFQQLMPDVLHWLGITRIDRFVSMSNMKYEALTSTGIEVGERVPLPDGLVPPDAQVELEPEQGAV